MNKEQAGMMISTFKKMEETLQELMIKYEEYISEEWMFNNARESIDILTKYIEDLNEKEAGEIESLNNLDKEYSYMGEVLSVLEKDYSSLRTSLDTLGEKLNKQLNK